MKLGFIGFQRSGKTTIGKQVAAALSLPFMDLDEALCKNLNVLSPDVAFQQIGAQAFRALEQELFLKYSTGVIAFGGGALQSIQHAHAQGVSLIYLHRPFEEIVTDLMTQNRPLWLPEGELLQAFETVWNHRHPIYNSCAFASLHAKRGAETKIVNKVVSLFTI